ncbi:MAG: hypothetical protein KDJ48_05455 [Nitratireductor sp.]|nr:hypothetical protein [Nitratireductor sp.]MCB1455596.1 hypothetical protein [Nitratireductor sp.]MCB1458697.1 hypothetical protein [Nitratireductor sp.]
MGIEREKGERSFAERIGDYLQQVDYKVANTEEQRSEVYRLRYNAYMREGSIDPNPSGLFHDDYDKMDNCWIFAIYEQERLISSIRLHVISKEFRKGPALDVFPDIVGPMVDKGMVLIDPTRFVADETAVRDYPELPYITLRVPCMASEYFDADLCLATVRKEHSAFYRRVFHSVPLCEPRPYPTLKQHIGLLSADVVGQRERMAERYPVFLSSLTERRMLFERPVAILPGDGQGSRLRNQVLN